MIISVHCVTDVSCVLSLYNLFISCSSLLSPCFPSLSTSSLTSSSLPLLSFLFSSIPLPLQLGVGSTDHVVVYDRHSERMMSSPRVWWMFRVSEMHTFLRLCWFVGSIMNFVVAKIQLISRGPDIPAFLHTPASFLQLFGHTATSVLDGGLMRWKFHGFPTISGDPQIPERRVFRAKLNTQLLRTYEQMIDNHTSRHEQVSVTQQCV